MGLEELGDGESAGRSGEAGYAQTDFSLGKRFRQRVESRPLLQHFRTLYRITGVEAGRRGAGGGGGGGGGAPAPPPPPPPPGGPPGGNLGGYERTGLRVV